MTLVSLLLVLAAPVPEAAARQEEPPRSLRVEQRLESLATLQLEGIDAEAARAADAVPRKPGPLPIAKPREVWLTPESDGTWERLDTGGWLWRLRVEVPGATELSFGFSRYRLPAGATLHVWSEAAEYWEGPYSSRDNKRHRELWTPVVPGDTALVELYVPEGRRDGVDLLLTRVNAGYRDLFGGLKLGPQGDCNNDVVCPEGDAWREQINSVALYTIQGTGVCTGTLINNTANDERPYFLSASHCTVNKQNDHTLVLYWNYHSPQCGLNDGGSLSDNQSGATFIVGKDAIDVFLAELDERPDDRFGVFFAGFDRTGDDPSSTVSIHHPQGGEKSISFDGDSPTTCSVNGLPHHFRVVWDDGTTEPGSSGSALFDEDNQLLIGTLTGGNASCELPNGFDCYASFRRFLAKTRKARKRLGLGANQPTIVEGRDSTCDCTAPNAIVGGPGRDILNGTGGDDILCGLGGNDVLKGKGGRDCLDGGDGNDKLVGGKKNDALHGGDGDDNCIGGKGKDTAGGCEKLRSIP